MSTPIEYLWKDSAWHPLPYWAKAAAAQFGEGEVARLERIEHRSQASHNSFFAWIHQIYQTLPEVYQGRWTSADDFRHWLLCFTAFCSRQEYACTTHAEAIRWAKNLGAEFHRVEVQGTTLVAYRAMSQSKRTMTARAFRESREALEVACAQVLKIHPDEIKRGGRAA